MIRLAATLIFLFALTAPMSGEASTEPARLSYSVSALKSGSPQERLLSAGLCLADAHGGRGDRLTALRSDSSSAWSPDGRMVAFGRVKRYSDGSIKFGIYVQNERGHTRSVYEVSSAGGTYKAVSTPSWSPNGRRIVFSKSSVCVHGCFPLSGLVSIRPDGSDLRFLTGGGLFVNDYDPAWSPRGDAIVFTSTDYGPGESAQGLYLVDPDGGNRRLLVPDGYAPSWSPDGASVVFARYGDYRDRSSLMIIGADGRGERVLTNQPGVEENPAWSPDGAWIAFEQRADCGPPCGQGVEGTDIALIRPDGTDSHVLLGSSSLAELQPAWRPSAPKRPGRPRPCVIMGTDRGDKIRGSSRGDLILAGRGRDAISGGGGDDLIDGGPAGDRVLGGTGADSLIGGFGSDRLVGGAGNDFLDSNDGGWPDVVIGGTGVDEATVDSHDRVSSVENVQRQAAIRRR